MKSIKFLCPSVLVVMIGPNRHSYPLALISVVFSDPLTMVVNTMIMGSTYMYIHVHVESNSQCPFDSNLDCSTLISKHIDDMKRWNISIPSVMQGLPSFYWLPKMHKDPYGARFIAASSKCTTKPLSKLLTSCLSLVMIDFKEYCEGIYRNTGIHCFWIVNNSQQVISTLKDINTSAKAKHYDSYDFSTLYTSIPHDSLKNNMSLLIDEAFKVRGAVYLSVNKRGKCYWAQAPNACMNIDRLELVAMIEYLVDNIFIHAGG